MEGQLQRAVLSLRRPIDGLAIRAVPLPILKGGILSFRLFKFILEKVGEQRHVDAAVVWVGERLRVWAMSPRHANGGHPPDERASGESGREVVGAESGEQMG